MKNRSGLTYIDFLKNISSGKLKNVYFVCANENYFINKAAEQLREKLFGSKDSRESFFIKYADDTKYAELLDLCNNFSSFFSDKKLVIVKNCEKFSRSLDHIFAYTETPNEDTIVMFAFDRDYAEEKKYTREFPFYDFSDMPEEFRIQWIKDEFKKHKCTIDDNELKMFISSMPRLYSIMEKEIEKISAYLIGSDEKKVTAGIILQMTGFDKESSPEDLMRAIAIRDRKKAADITEFLLNKAGINAVYLVSTIARYFIDLMGFKHPGMDSKPKGEYYKLRMWGDSIDFGKQYHKAFSHKQLSSIFQKLLETDRKLKTTQIDNGVLISSMIEEMIDT